MTEYYILTKGYMNFKTTDAEFQVVFVSLDDESEAENNSVLNYKFVEETDSFSDKTYNKPKTNGQINSASLITQTDNKSS